MRWIYMIIMILIIVLNFVNVSSYKVTLDFNEDTVNDFLLYSSSVLSFYYIHRFIILDKLYRELMWISNLNIKLNCFNSGKKINERFWDDVFVKIYSNLTKNVNTNDDILSKMESLRLEFLSDNSIIDNEKEKKLKESINGVKKIIWIFKNL